MDTIPTRTLFPRQSGTNCVTCPSVNPTCGQCPSNQQCVIINQSCESCSHATCVAQLSSGSSSGGGVSKGALAGAVIGVLIFLSASIVFYIWYRRRLPKGTAQPHEVKDVPAKADAVLRRPDPNEKRLQALHAAAATSPTDGASASVRVYSSNDGSTINLDPEAQRGIGLAIGGSGSFGANSADRRRSAQESVVSNPFTDTQSLQSASESTQSTNVIPIALVPHGTVITPSGDSSITEESEASSSPSIPVRPPRSPDLNIRLDSSSLNYDHTNVSEDSVPVPPRAPYAHSQMSGLSGASSRASYLTTGSYASDILNEAPQIVNSSTGSAVRQVLGVVRAEMIRAPGSIPTTPLTPDGSLPQQQASAAATAASSRVLRPPARSPLAQSSFGPSDLIAESEVEHETSRTDSLQPPNPFGDEHGQIAYLPSNDGSTYSPSPSVTTFGIPTPRTPNTPAAVEASRRSTASSEWLMRAPPPPLPTSDFRDSTDLDSRPTSMFTNAGSVIGADIGTAERVLMTPAASSIGGGPGTPHSRMTTAAKVIVSPSLSSLAAKKGNGNSGGDRQLQEQQAQAIAVARARAEASGLGRGGVGNGIGTASRRVSASTTVSVGADSLLESFTFVPPSPISSLPSRSPPQSPMPNNSANGNGKAQTFSMMSGSTSTTSSNILPPSIMSSPRPVLKNPSSSLAPSNRQLQQSSSSSNTNKQHQHQQHLSTVSQVSALDGYTFHIDQRPISGTSTTTTSTGNGSTSAVSGGSRPRNSRRASLDTLALTADLSAFPLNFDQERDSFDSRK